MMLILMVARRGGEGERHVRSGAWTGWRPTHLLGTKVSGKTLGLIGLGRIGRAVARRAHHGFGMRSEEHTSELQSRLHLVCRLLLEKKKESTTRDIRGEN